MGPLGGAGASTGVTGPSSLPLGASDHRPFGQGAEPAETIQGMSASIRRRLAADQSGAISVSALLWLAVAGVLIYALLSAYYGDRDRFGRVPVPGEAIVDLPSVEADISYAEDAVDGAPEMVAPGDLRIEVHAAGTGAGLDIDPRGSTTSEEDGQVLRSVAAVNAPEAGLYEIRATSSEAAARPGPELLIGESPFGAFGDRLSRVVDLLQGPIGVVLAILVVAAIAIPRLLRAIGR